MPSIRACRPRYSLYSALKSFLYLWRCSGEPITLYFLQKTEGRAGFERKDKQKSKNISSHFHLPILQFLQSCFKEKILTINTLQLLVLMKKKYWCCCTFHSDLKHSLRWMKFIFFVDKLLWQLEQKLWTLSLSSLCHLHALPLTFWSAWIRTAGVSTSQSLSHTGHITAPTHSDD